MSLEPPFEHTRRAQIAGAGFVHACQQGVSKSSDCRHDYDWPLLGSAALTIAATFWKAPASATEVPPNFITVGLIVTTSAIDERLVNHRGERVFKPVSEPRAVATGS